MYELAMRALVDVCDAKGYDLPLEAINWAQAYIASLRDRGADLEIAELLRAGCAPLPLAASLIVPGWLNSFPTTFYEAIAEPKRLEHMVEHFGSTALLFDSLARTLPPAIKNDWPEGLCPSPWKMAQQLRDYTLLASVPTVLKNFGIRYERDCERFLPTAYVKQATGDWHDREVAASISAARGLDLDEGAHRNWRNRNYKNIDFPAEIVYGLAQALADEHHSRRSK